MIRFLLLFLGIGGLLGAAHMAILYGVDGGTVAAVMLSGVVIHIGRPRGWN